VWIFSDRMACRWFATLNGESKSSFENIVVPAGGVVILAPKDWDEDSD